MEFQKYYTLNRLLSEKKTDETAKFVHYVYNKNKQEIIQLLYRYPRHRFPDFINQNNVYISLY